MILIKYNNQNITTLAKSGKWQHPETGVKYPSNWDFSAVEGITIETLPEPEPYVPTMTDLMEQIREALQSAIDAQAKELGFTSGNNLILYAGFTNPYQSLATSFATWEAQVWYDAELYKNDVLAGLKVLPTPAESVTMMPIYEGM
jgi:hypothetical protein